MEAEKFDLLLVTEKFKSSLELDDDVLMDLYLQAFHEILKFVLILALICERKFKEFRFQVFSTDGFNLWLCEL